MCLAYETGHRLANRERQNNSAQEGALLCGGTHRAQHGASKEKDGFGKNHDEVDDEEIGWKSTNNCDDEVDEDVIGQNRIEVDR